MCGILGIASKSGTFSDDLVQRAIRTLGHRGPDRESVVKLQDGTTDIWLAHRRLSIVDLSEAGNQPMTQGDHTLIFNGELYNFRELRGSLDGGLDMTSDTAVLLGGLRQHGVSFLERCNAMFAFSLLDRKQGTITLARDRIGKKPLYLWSTSTHVAWASELKALIALGMPRDVDETARAYYRWMGYIPGTSSPYKAAKRLPAGASLTFSVRTDTFAVTVDNHELFWDPLISCGTRFEGSYEEAQEEFASLLEDATRLRLNADVPVGLFLSGGIDSTLVATALHRLHPAERVTAFSFVSLKSEYDESETARSTAQRLDLSFEPVEFTDSCFERQMVRYASLVDEPLCDTSMPAIMALSEAATREVRAVLTGDGGDELFLGYPWFDHAARCARIATRLAAAPNSLRQVAARAIGTKLGIKASRLATLAVGRNAATMPYKIQLAQAMLRNAPADELYTSFRAMCPWTMLSEEDRQRLGTSSLQHFATSIYPSYSWHNLAERTEAERLAMLDFVTYLRDGVLVKVDRGTMAHSVEARSPLLDYRIVEFANSLPHEFKANKRLLRDLLKRQIPGGLAMMKKQGFGVRFPHDMKTDGLPSVQYSRWIEDFWLRNVNDV